MVTYTKQELDDFAVMDLLNDADHSEEQAMNGPYYPEKGVTKDTLLEYAKKCRDMAAKYSNGGAHDALINNKES